MRRDLYLVLGIGCLWIVQHLSAGWLSPKVPSLWLEAGALFCVVLTLTIMSYGMGLSTRSNTHWGRFFVIGGLQAAIPGMLLSFGHLPIDQAVSASMLGAMPLYLGMLAPILLRNVPIKLENYLSIALAMFVLVALFYPEFIGSNHLNGLVFICGMLTTAVSFMLILLILEFIKQEHPLIIARNVLAIVLAQLFFISLLIRPDLLVDTALPSILVLLNDALMIATVLYFIGALLLRRSKSSPPSIAGFYAMLCIGVLFSAIHHYHAIQPTTWAALIVICAAMAVQTAMSQRDTKTCFTGEC